MTEFLKNNTFKIYRILIGIVFVALAWTGLKDTAAWNNLSQTERDNINQTVTDFFNNNPNCQ